MQKRIFRSKSTIYHLPTTNSGFSLVELIIVIAIIAILATLGLASYNAEIQNSTSSSLQSGLKNASKQLVVDQIRSSTGIYPATPAAANSGAGISFSSGTTVVYNVDNTDTPKTFCLSATQRGQSYFITQEGTPLAGPCPILYFDAGIQTSYPGTGTSLGDLSGLGNNGTLVGGVTYSSLNSGSLVFDGSSGYVNVGSLGSFYSQGTISFWMNPSVVENYRNPFSTKYLGGNSGIRFEEHAVGTPPNFDVIIGDDSGSYTDGVYLLNSGLVANNWYHITLVWSIPSSNIVGYLNGVSVFDQTQTLWPTTLPSITIGGGFNSDRYWKGSVSNVQMYNRALSSNDVQQNFNTLKGRYGL